MTPGLSRPIGSLSRPAPGRAPARGTVSVVGLGNIGSHLARLLARMSGQVARLVLVDADVYSAPNLVTQEITAADVGRSKVDVIADQLRLINPELVVTPLAQRVENLPRGLFRSSDVVVAGLDSRRARLFVSELSTRLAIPYYVDAGVEASQLLARVATFTPGPDAACPGCGFSDADAAALGHTLPCPAAGESETAEEAPATGAPAFLGALAASIAAAQVAQLLAGEPCAGLVGRELVMSAAHHTHFLSALRRDPVCRFSHDAWHIDDTPASANLSVGELLGLGEERMRAGPAELRVEPHRFVTRLCCLDCARSRDVLRLSGRVLDSTCPCGGVMVPVAFDTLDRISAATLPTPWLRSPLADLGLLPADVVSLVAGDTACHFELGG